MPSFADDMMKKLLGMAIQSATTQLIPDLAQLLLDRDGAPVTVVFYIHDNKLEVEMRN